MFRTVIDSKRGKVWVNHPLDPRMIEVADADENGDQYWGWVKLITSINSAAENGNELVLKKVEKMFDSEHKLTYTSNSDRGNPTDL